MINMIHSNFTSPSTLSNIHPHPHPPPIHASTHTLTHPHHASTHAPNPSPLIYHTRSVTAIAGQCGEHLEELHLDGENLDDISLQKICTCTQLQTLLIGFAGAFSDQAIANIKVSCRVVNSFTLQQFLTL